MAGLSRLPTRFGAESDGKGRGGQKSVVSETIATTRRCLDSSLRRRGVDGRDKPGQDGEAPRDRVGSSPPTANALRAFVGIWVQLARAVGDVKPRLDAAPLRAA
jgi:hypothetical protein